MSEENVTVMFLVHGDKLSQDALSELQTLAERMRKVVDLDRKLDTFPEFARAANFKGKRNIEDASDLLRRCGYTVAKTEEEAPVSDNRNHELDAAISLVQRSGLEVNAGGTNDDLARAVGILHTLSTKLHSGEFLFKKDLVAEPDEFLDKMGVGR